MILPRMLKVEILILKSDVHLFLAHAGHCEYLQLDSPEGPRSYDADREILSGLRSIAEYLGLSGDDIDSSTLLPDETARRRALEWIESVFRLQNEEKELEGTLNRLRALLCEKNRLPEIGVPWEDLVDRPYLKVRVGSVSTTGTLKTNVAAIVTLQGNPEAFQIGFDPIPLPSGKEESKKDLERKLETAQKRLETLEAERRRRTVEIGAELFPVLAAFSMEAQISLAIDGLESGRNVSRLSGWIAAADQARFTTDLKTLTKGRFVLRTLAADEVREVREGRETVPVCFRHGTFLKSFERMILAYGVPLYGTIDPTPFTAAFFLFLFALMFGDLGQGLLIFLLGVFLASSRVKGLKGWIPSAAVFKAAGLGSMATGLIYGSFFSNETVLVPFGRWVTGLWGHSTDRILTVLPTVGFATMAGFFLFTLGIGSCILLTGLFFNLVHQFRRRDWQTALFDKTGLAGMLLLVYGVFFALRIGLGGTPSWFDGVGFSLPLAAMVIGKKRSADGVGALVLDAAVEILETVSYYAANSLSFLRVGAFAVSHAVLSTIVFTLAELSIKSGGGFGAVLIVLIGNGIILGLEGLIVAVQDVRLQYYEFFSKFFVETGEAFRPFRFETKEVTP